MSDARTYGERFIAEILGDIDAQKNANDIKIAQAIKNMLASCQEDIDTATTSLNNLVEKYASTVNQIGQLANTHTKELQELRNILNGKQGTIADINEKIIKIGDNTKRIATLENDVKAIKGQLKQAGAILGV